MGDKSSNVIIMENANRSGVEMSPTILNFLEKVALLYGKPISVQCGTNHNQFSASELPSDHWLGNAADIYTYADVQGYDTPTGDHIAEAALVAAGMERSTVLKEVKKGGLWNVFTKERRTQVIWRTDVGGNHHDHVHIGVRARKQDEPESGYQVIR